MVDDLELRLNRAAESAVPLAKDVFIQAIGQMTLTDAEKIYTGPTDSATQYFKHTMTPLLTTRMTPIVEKSLADAGAIKAFDDVMQKYSAGAVHAQREGRPDELRRPEDARWNVLSMSARKRLRSARTRALARPIS
jgi:hypothetical protein